MSHFLNRFKLSEQTQKLLQDRQKLKERLHSGEVLEALLDFSPEVMAEFYQRAYHLFEEKHYQDAADAFLFLVTINPTSDDYWLDLGMATQLVGDYEGAIDAYEIAAIQNQSSPVPYFYLAKCLFAIHDRKNALEAFEMAIEAAGDAEEYEELKRQAKAAYDVLSKHF